MDKEYTLEDRRLRLADSGPPDDHYSPLPSDEEEQQPANPLVPQTPGIAPPPSPHPSAGSTPHPLGIKDKSCRGSSNLLSSMLQQKMTAMATMTTKEKASGNADTSLIDFLDTDIREGVRAVKGTSMTAARAMGINFPGPTEGGKRGGAFMQKLEMAKATAQLQKDRDANAKKQPMERTWGVISDPSSSSSSLGDNTDGAKEKRRPWIEKASTSSSSRNEESRRRIDASRSATAAHPTAAVINRAITLGAKDKGIISFPNPTQKMLAPPPPTRQLTKQQHDKHFSSMGTQTLKLPDKETQTSNASNQSVQVSSPDFFKGRARHPSATNISQTGGRYYAILSNNNNNNNSAIAQKRKEHENASTTNNHAEYPRKVRVVNGGKGRYLDTPARSKDLIPLLQKRQEEKKKRGFALKLTPAAGNEHDETYARLLLSSDAITGNDGKSENNNNQEELGGNKKSGGGEPSEVSQLTPRQLKRAVSNIKRELAETVAAYVSGPDTLHFKREFRCQPHVAAEVFKAEELAKSTPASFKISYTVPEFEYEYISHSSSKTPLIPLGSKVTGPFGSSRSMAYTLSKITLFYYRGVLRLHVDFGTPKVVLPGQGEDLEDVRMAMLS